MAAITWKNVGWEGPPIGSASDGGGDEGMFSSLKKAITDNVKSEEKKATNSIYRRLAGLSDSDTYAGDAAAIMGNAPRQADMEKLAAFQQGRKTALLNQEAQQFQNETADERLQASLASSRAYARTANEGATKAERMRADREKARKVVNGVERNADGSPKRKMINAIAVEQDIHPDALKLEIDIADINTGYAAKREGELLLDERKHAKAVKSTPTYKSSDTGGNMGKNNWIRRQILNDGGGNAEKVAWKKKMIAEGHEPSLVSAAADGGGVASSMLGFGSDEWSESKSIGLMGDLEKGKVQRAADALRKGQ